MNLRGRDTAYAPEGLISAGILPQTVLVSSCRIPGDHFYRQGEAQRRRFRTIAGKAGKSLAQQRGHPLPLPLAEPRITPGQHAITFPHPPLE